MQMTLRSAVLAAISVCAVASVQAATLDAVTGLSWQGFQTEQAGVEAGFRLATDVEFRQYLTDKGFTGGPSYYSPGADTASLSLDGLHLYDKKLTFSDPETHQIQAGWLATASGALTGGIIGYDYVPSQCPNPSSSGQISYCGGRSSAWAYVGDFVTSDAKVNPANYSRMDFQYLYGTKPINYLMVSAPVPEPSSWAMLTLGLVALAGRQARRRQQA